MDETLVFFDMVPDKSFAKKGFKSVIARTSDCEKSTNHCCEWGYFATNNYPFWQK